MRNEKEVIKCVFFFIYKKFYHIKRINGTKKGKYYGKKN